MGLTPLLLGNFRKGINPSLRLKKDTILLDNSKASCRFYTKTPPNNQSHKQRIINKTLTTHPSQIGRGWYVNMGFEHYVMTENEERSYVEDDLVLTMNGTHIHADLPEIRVIWDGVTTAHVVLQEDFKNTKTCGICGGNYGENSFRSSMLGQDEALRLVVDSRLDYYQQCEPSYLQVSGSIPSALVGSWAG